jgi:hypothetical protein
MQPKSDYKPQRRARRQDELIDRQSYDFDLDHLYGEDSVSMFPPTRLHVVMAKNTAM